MLFSCPASYRAIASQPLFRQFPIVILGNRGTMDRIEGVWLTPSENPVPDRSPLLSPFRRECPDHVDAAVAVKRVLVGVAQILRRISDPRSDLRGLPLANIFH